MIKKIFNKLRENLWALPYLPWSIWFNFHYLPLNQAIKLPILLAKPRLIKSNGTISIMGGVHFGMIRLGIHRVSIYPHKGVTFENHGGDITFNGPCILGSGTFISIGKRGKLEIGANVEATAELKLICYNSIKLDNFVLIGWENFIMDTSFHQLTTPTGAPKGTVTSPIHIGAHTWLGFKCSVMPGADIPKKCVVASNSLVNKKYYVEPYTLVAGVPAVVKAAGVWRDYQNDKVDY